MATKGWLPYGSNHASVVIQDPLTVQPTDAASHLNGKFTFFAVGSNALGWTSHDAAAHHPTHDTHLGVKFVSQEDGTTEVMYRARTSAADMKTIGAEGQISIEVETNWAEYPPLQNGYDGYNPAATEHLIGCISSPSSGFTSFFWKDPNFAVRARVYGEAGGDFRNHVHAGGVNQPKISAYGKGRFVTLNIGWKGSYNWFAVDGVIVAAGFSTKSATERLDLFDYLYLGGDGSANKAVDKHWVRNLQISTEAPTFNVCSDVKHIGVLADSIFDDTTATSIHGGDNEMIYRLYRKFEREGLRVNVTVSENGGETVSVVAGNDLIDHLDGAAAGDLDLNIGRYDVVVIQGGNNDAAQAKTATEFAAGYKAIIEKVLGENGGTDTGVKRVYLMQIPPFDGQKADAGHATDLVNAALLRAQIAALPAWWDETYSARAGIVRVVDCYTALGGENPSKTGLSIGELAGTYTDFHLAHEGTRIYGDLLADAIFEDVN